MPKSVGTLRSYLASLRMFGFSPDVIIVDYINLMQMDGDHDTRYEGLGGVYVGLRSIAQEPDVVMVTAAQAN